MQKLVLFGLIKSLHDLFTAFWIGGMLTTAFSFMPAVKSLRSMQDASKRIMKEYQNRLRIFAVISIIVLWITGFLLARQSGGQGGFLAFTTTYQSLISVKHIFVILMVVIAVVRGFVFGRNVENFNPSQQKSYVLLLVVNVILGVAVLFLSGFSAALA